MTGRGYEGGRRWRVDVRAGRLGMAVGAVAIMGAVTSNSASVSAVDTVVSARAAVTVPALCTMSGVLNEPHTAMVAGGLYQSEIGKTTITTFCNDSSGYALYAIGYTGDAYTGENHTKMTGTASGTNIATGTAKSGSTSNWAMKLTSVAGDYAPALENGYGNYGVVPDTFTKVASYAHATDGEGGAGSSVETTYAIFVSGSQPADTYTGKVKYVLVHPATNVAGTYTIAYNANGGTGAMSSDTGIYNFEPHMLPSSTFTAPSGYEFAGWCTTNTSQNECTDGTLYAAGDELTEGASAGGTLNLYAVWKKVLTLADITTMQEMTPEVCGATVVGATNTLVDNRGDKKSYTVAKLADNNCWMTQNLDLDIVAGTTYTDADTDLKVGETWTPALSTYTDSSWDWSYTTPESYDPGNRCWNGTLDTSWGGNLGNMTETCSEGSHYQIGNYYNWTAAVAMNDSSSHSTNYEDVNQSICPAGWRLPTYSGDKSYANLISEIGNVTSGTSGNIQNNPLYFVYGGYWDGSSDGVGSRGDYWSSVVYYGDRSYVLYFDVDGYLYPQGYGIRNYGSSVRCVAR